MYIIKTRPIESYHFKENPGNSKMSCLVPNNANGSLLLHYRELCQKLKLLAVGRLSQERWLQAVSEKYLLSIMFGSYNSSLYDKNIFHAVPYSKKIDMIVMRLI